MDLIRKIPKNFTKNFVNKVINRQYFRRRTGLKSSRIAFTWERFSRSSGSLQTETISWIGLLICTLKSDFEMFLKSGWKPIFYLLLKIQIILYIKLTISTFLLTMLPGLKTNQEIGLHRLRLRFSSFYSRKMKFWK